jgi:biotin-(acetyl-CoA carboxylase) ligase
MLDDWASCDWLTGFRVRVTAESGELEGRYTGLSADGRLTLVTDDGTSHQVLAGDVERLLPDEDTPN